MSSQVTVQSVQSTTVTLTYDSGDNAALARYVANAIQLGIGSSAITPVDSMLSGTPAPLFGKTGEWVQDTSGSVTIPKGYDYIVDAAPIANINDTNVDTNQSLLVGSGNVVFTGVGAGSIFGGGGNDSFAIAARSIGPWDIAIGNGNDTVKALGGGNDTISVGTGNDSIVLGGGNSTVTTSGAATITAAGGDATITGNGTTVIFGAAGKLDFIAGGAATVIGGSGSATLTGGSGRDYFVGGSNGDNVLTGGSGAATLTGGGGGDSLFAGGSGAQILFAASGNETLSGSSVGGANDTFVGGTGNTTVLASATDTNLFEFIKGAGGGSLTETGLTSIEQIAVHLANFASNDLGSVVSQTNTGGNLNVLLSDGTQIVFKNITAPLTNSNFS